MKPKKAFLIFSFFTINIIALLYGVSPSWFIDTFLLGKQDPGVDQAHILRAMMMLYIGLGFFWLYCAFSDKYRDAGILVIAVFCGGLVSGRILSFAADGIPSLILSIYLVMELAMIPICVWLLRKDDTDNTSKV